MPMRRLTYLLRVSVSKCMRCLEILKQIQRCHQKYLFKAFLTFSILLFDVNYGLRDVGWLTIETPKHFVKCCVYHNVTK